jgi:hypothetical protein
MAHDQQIIRVGAYLEELAGAVEERGARGGKQDIAPMGREHIGLTVAACECNDDFDLRHAFLIPKLPPRLPGGGVPCRSDQGSWSISQDNPSQGVLEGKPGPWQRG